MRPLLIAILCVLSSAASFSQPRLPLQLKGELKTDDAEDLIVTEKLLPGEDKLLVVGRKSIRVWDLTSTKLLASRPIEVPVTTEDHSRLISPDGRFMLVFGNYDSKAKQDKTKRPASIWNLETGKQIALLDIARKTSSLRQMEQQRRNFDYFQCGIC